MAITYSKRRMAVVKKVHRKPTTLLQVPLKKPPSSAEHNIKNLNRGGKPNKSFSMAKEGDTDIQLQLKFLLQENRSAGFISSSTTCSPQAPATA
ncbi:hypothetical protein NPIL_123701 [Nephila pilipes]|uniref:Uncharacterized protein n=1 Tax=Nephila pilipes TaxID=299642 RepID=A0A8X6R196_NEPPI|nr:hypothetical protein NPIL_123701 [Nephila pilipes]